MIVWLALAWNGHCHYSIAHEWFSNAGSGEAHFCRYTQLALLRLLTNRSVMGSDRLTPRGAWQIWDGFARDTRVGFTEEPADLWEELRATTRNLDDGANFWMDAYLLAFAAVSGMTIVTFDGGFRKFKNARSLILASQ